MDLQETIVLRIQWERESHLATNYGPEGLQRTTHAPSERHKWRWWTPSEMVSRLDLVVLDSVVVSWTLLGFLKYWGIYRANSRFRGHPRWAQPTRVRLGLLACPGGLCCPRNTPLVLHWPNKCLLVQKKSTKSFVVFGLLLVLISCDVKTCRKQQLALGTMSIS